MPVPLEIETYLRPRLHRQVLASNNPVTAWTRGVWGDIEIADIRPGLQNFVTGEEPIPSAIVSIYPIRIPLPFEKIGVANSLHLGHIQDVLKLQPHGEDGLLLTNDYGNIFPIQRGKKVEGVLTAYWYDPEHRRGQRSAPRRGWILGFDYPKSDLPLQRGLRIGLVSELC